MDAQLSIGDDAHRLVEQTYEWERRRGATPMMCYLAAIDALHAAYPDWARHVVAKEAVRIVTEKVRIAKIADGPGLGTLLDYAKLTSAVAP